MGLRPQLRRRASGQGPRRGLDPWLAGDRHEEGLEGRLSLRASLTVRRARRAIVAITRRAVVAIALTSAVAGAGWIVLGTLDGPWGMLPGGAFQGSRQVYKNSLYFWLDKKWQSTYQKNWNL